MESEADNGIRKIDLAKLRAQFVGAAGLSVAPPEIRCDLCSKRLKNGDRYVLLLRTLKGRTGARLEVGRAHVECAMHQDFIPRVEGGRVKVWTKRRDDGSEAAETQTADAE